MLAISVNKFIEEIGQAKGLEQSALCILEQTTVTH